MTVITASLTAENTFSDVLETRGSFGFSLSGTFSLRLQYNVAVTIAHGVM
jgi:hypothetical protein